MPRYEGNEQEQVYLWVRDAVPDHLKVIRNHRFLAPRRKLELDVSIPSAKLGIEVDGIGGSHMMIKGWNRDREKDLEAACVGWRVVRVTTVQVRDGSAFRYLETILFRYVEGIANGR